VAAEKKLTISNPAIGGSGYLTLAAMQADAAIAAGFHAAIHQCRGLAQAGGPLCIDVVIRGTQVVGAVPHNVDYVNGFELCETWRAISSVENFQISFPRGLTVLSDYFVEEPILVTASQKGPRYLTREEFVEKFEELISKGCDLRMVAYDFAKHNFAKILKGPFSFGVLIADLYLRQNDNFIKLSKEAAIEGLLRNVPTKKGGMADEQRRQLNQQVFEKGYEARERFAGPRDARTLYI
jgi:Pyruvate/2-oxoacid:ferredoxin oxidoreductase gamma subunit